jgi:hypothetical protein
LGIKGTSLKRPNINEIASISFSGGHHLYILLLLLLFLFLLLLFLLLNMLTSYD